MKTYARIICLLLALCGVLALVSCKGEKDDGAGDAKKPDVKYQATEGLLVYFIYRASYFSEEDQIEHNFDPEKSLKDQMYDDEYTWYDILVERAADNLTSLLVWCNAAADDGVELSSGELQEIENMLGNQRITAAAEGYTLDDYLAMTYGNTYITEAVLKSVYELQYLWQKYSGLLEERFTASLTEQMIESQVEEDSGTDTTPTKNIGIILLAAEKYGSIEDASAEAEDILAQLLAGQPSYELFEEYANQYSDSSEFYYKNVSRGDMLAEIDTWLYDTETRAVGDMDVIAFDWGAIIVYYESDGDTHNVAEAKVELVDKMFEDWFAQMKEKFGDLVSDELIDSLELDF